MGKMGALNKAHLPSPMSKECLVDLIKYLTNKVGVDSKKRVNSYVNFHFLPKLHFI